MSRGGIQNLPQVGFPSRRRTSPPRLFHLVVVVVRDLIALLLLDSRLCCCAAGAVQEVVRWLRRGLRWPRRPWHHRSAERAETVVYLLLEVAGQQAWCHGRHPGRRQTHHRAAVRAARSRRVVCTVVCVWPPSTTRRACNLDMISNQYSLPVWRERKNCQRHHRTAQGGPEQTRTDSLRVPSRDRVHALVARARAARTFRAALSAPLRIARTT